MTEASRRPDGSGDLVPGPTLEVPSDSAPLSRRALRDQREQLATTPAAAPAEVSTGRRARRDITGLEHLLLAPVEATPSRASGLPVASAPTASRPRVAPAEVSASTVPVQVVVASVVTPAEPIVPSSHPDLAAEPIAAGPSTDASLAADPRVTVADVPVAHTADVPAPAFPIAASAPVAATVSTSVAAPRGARASVSSSDAGKRVLPRLGRGAGPGHPVSRKRTVVNSVVMVATAGLVATLALPAYAYSESDSLESPRIVASNDLGIQSLTVKGVNSQSSTRDGYTTTGDIAAMDSTTGTTVSPTVQALASELMADVASGKLVGSVPDHIVEIRNLANGVAVQGCGVDYRVLQTIKVAVDNFDKVGVSDINRYCTGQLEGAGTASSHYKDGGGHAVDFYILNGHGLTGADSDSVKLIKLLDPLVPSGSGLGQASCGRSVSLSNFAPFNDSCTHLHVDFGAAKGVSLGG